MREQLGTAEEQRNKGQDLLKNLDFQRLKMMEESDFRHKVKESELEKEIEEKTREFDE